MLILATSARHQDQHRYLKASDRCIENGSLGAENPFLEVPCMLSSWVLAVSCQKMSQPCSEEFRDCSVQEVIHLQAKVVHL